MSKPEIKPVNISNTITSINLKLEDLNLKVSHLKDLLKPVSRQYGYGQVVDSQTKDSSLISYSPITEDLLSTEQTIVDIIETVDKIVRNLDI